MIRILLAAALVALLFAAWAFVSDEPTAERCCENPSDPSTCDAYLWEFKDGVFVRRVECPKR